MAERRLHLGVALDGAGWHPGAWREPSARPADLLTGGYWVDLVQRAEAALLDFVTFEDSFGVTLDAAGRLRTDRVQGRLDAVLTATRVAPATSAIGLIPTVSTTHTEPFHISKAVATLDWVSRGRAGVRVQVSPSPVDARHVGRRADPAADDLLAEAADHVEVQRRLWDSWEDDAEIRDVATGRFVDIDKLHRIDFTGPFFSVRGPSITPRPPQGQPLVAALAHTPRVRAFAAGSADLAFVTPIDADDADDTASDVAQRAAAAGRSGAVTVLADLLVVLAPTEAQAHDRLGRLDDLAGEPLRSDATTFVGTPDGLADVIESWTASGALGGFRLRPAGLPADLELIAGRLVPALQARGLFRTTYAEGTLRARFGLDRPPSRYATAGARP